MRRLLLRQGEEPLRPERVAAVQIADLLTPLVVDTDVTMEVSSFAAVALGLTFVGTCHAASVEAMLQARAQPLLSRPLMSMLRRAQERLEQSSMDASAPALPQKASASPTSEASAGEGHVCGVASGIVTTCGD